MEEAFQPPPITSLQIYGFIPIPATYLPRREVLFRIEACNFNT